MFPLPPDPEAFNQTVWAITLQIPEGTVSTFGQIASMIPAPSGADPEEYRHYGPRWVGKAMNLALQADQVPWQRVINSQGRIALPENSRGAIMQRARLEVEGVVFDSRDRVDFNRCGWDGPPAEWLAGEGLLPPVSLRKPSASVTGSQDSASQLSLF